MDTGHTDLDTRLGQASRLAILAFLVLSCVRLASSMLEDPSTPGVVRLRWHLERARARVSLPRSGDETPEVVREAEHIITAYLRRGGVDAR